MRHNGVFSYKVYSVYDGIIDKRDVPFYNVYQDVEKKSRKLFNQYRDISIGERNEKETFEYGLGVFTLRSIYLD